MMTANVLQRTFFIQHGGNTGTAFAFDIDNRQYLITAAHVVSGFTDGEIKIFFKDRWTELPCKLVGSGKTKAGDVIPQPDLAVLAPAYELAPRDLPLEARSKGLMLAQTIYFLGYPYGQMQNVPKELNRDFPLPLVKSGIVSAFNMGENKDVMLLDGHNNVGFSGAPVVFVQNNFPPGEKNPFIVAGVVSSYPAPQEPVFDPGGNRTGHYVQTNPGIVNAFHIEPAIGMIQANPIGLKIS